MNIREYVKTLFYRNRQNKRKKELLIMKNNLEEIQKKRDKLVQAKKEWNEFIKEKWGNEEKYF